MCYLILNPCPPHNLSILRYPSLNLYNLYSAHYALVNVKNMWHSSEPPLLCLLKYCPIFNPCSAQNPNMLSCSFLNLSSAHCASANENNMKFPSQFLRLILRYPIVNSFPAQNLTMLRCFIPNATRRTRRTMHLQICKISDLLFKLHAPYSATLS